jgi:hypothetical protein
MKKVLIASFQRSGTHFLINNMATNFAGIEDGWFDVVHGKENRWVKDVNRRNIRDKIREQLVDVYYKATTTKCLKTHYQMYFFERHLDSICDKYDILYVVRDPRDTMVACFHYYNNTNYELFVKEPVFSKFIRTELWETQTERQPFSYSYVKPRNIVDKWNKHVLSWLHYKDKGVVFVKFSELKSCLQKTLTYIQSKTSQSLRPSISAIPLEDKRYRPDFCVSGIKRGEVGIWKQYFTEEDSLYLDQTLSADTKQFMDI